jgi:hypothetical protein
MTKLPSPEEIATARTPRGAWTRAQLSAWGYAEAAEDRSDD